MTSFACGRFLIKAIGETFKHMSSLINYLKDAKAEIVHISWPSRETVINHTFVVIVISVAVGIGLGFLDNGFGKALAIFIGAR